MRSDLPPRASMRPGHREEGRQESRRPVDPRRLCKPSHPLPTAPVGESIPDSRPSSNLSMHWRPPLTHAMDKIRLNRILALEMKSLLEPSEGLREENQKTFTLTAEK